MIELRQLEKKDYNRAITFAVQGMNFDKYIDNDKILYYYGKYFLYMELQRATQVVAAYREDKLVGVLIADIKGEAKTYRTLWKSIYVKCFNLIMNMIEKDANTAYNDANKEILEKYLNKEKPDGEICFLSADPEAKGKGIGSIMLQELERREAGKLIYLFTDNNCTYQFYDRRGFKQVDSREINMEIDKKQIPLTCLLYSKQFTSGNSK